MSIVLSKINKRFGQQLIINNISHEIFNGELFVLLGSSGSGKSTLLRIIAGLIHANSGSIIINNKDVTNLPPQKRSTGFVFQNYSVFRHMTVQDNVEFGLKIRNMVKEERKNITADLLDLVGLTGLEKRYADELSGGQLQRVALARALAYQPSVLLLDEPFGALDVKIRSQLRKSLREIQSKVKVTTVLVTHDQEEAFELADRIGIINHGQLIEVEKPEMLYNFPKYEFTATFIGGGNVLIGRKEKNTVKLGTALLPFSENAPLHDENAPVRILFRPESVVLSLNKLPDDVFTIGKARVNEVKFNGSFFKLSLNVNELKGVQALEPRSSYGESSVRIEAIVSGTNVDEGIFNPDNEFWLGLKNYHILHPLGLKILVFIEQSSSDSASAQFGLVLAKITGGLVTLFSVVDSQSKVSDELNNLEKIRQSHQRHLNLITATVSMGNITEEIIRETQAGQYEIIIFNWQEETSTFISKALQVLTLLKVPVILLKNPHLRVQKILICTAAGEPGKEDIKFGGRVAKLTGASVTLFHVIKINPSKENVQRAERHLLLGKSSLEALNVTTEIKIEEGDSPVDKIHLELENNKYDLIIIGSPAPGNVQHFYWKDLTSGIISKSNIPVLIVPMLNE